jgi:hypothetical protein
MLSHLHYNYRVLAQLLRLGNLSYSEPVFECICRSEECILSFVIKKLQHMILYCTPTVSYAWYVIHINFHVMFRCILCWHCFMCVIRVLGLMIICFDLLRIGNVDGLA